MRIPLKINNKSVTVDCEPDSTLESVLRGLKLFSVKDGCTDGFCGSSTVLLDEKAVPSCLVPVAAVKDRSIITLEYFMQSDTYTDIAQAFEKNGITLCGFCDAGRIFAAKEIIELNQRPDKKMIAELLRTFSCPCTEDESLIKGIVAAADMRRKRLGNRYGLR